MSKGKGTPKNEVIEGVSSLAKTKKKGLCQANDLSLSQLNDKLTYKAIVPSEDSNSVGRLEDSVLEILNDLQENLLLCVSEEDLPRLKNKVVENIKSNFLNKGCYSEAHLESLFENGELVDAEPIELSEEEKAAKSTKSEGVKVEM